MKCTRFLKHKQCPMFGVKRFFSEGRRWIMKRHFQGMPTLEDFEIKSEPLQKLKDNEILLQPEFWSVDPYARIYPISFGYKLPMTMLGSQVAQVMESKNPKYPVGSHVVAYTGWRELAVVDPDAVYDTYGKGPTALPKVSPAYELPEGMSRSLLLGAVGMPGNSAYFGLLDICDPKEGETVVVSGAAGAVGMLVGQIAKTRGCHVVGIAGSEDKCQYLTQELGFDSSINYKKNNVKSALKRAAPKGVDCYFDNVGGNISQAVFMNMNMYGRISVCGAITGYNDTSPTLYPALQPTMVAFQLKMEGFFVWRWLHRGQWDEGLHQMSSLIKEGKVKPKETFYDGFENLPHAFIGMLNGDNFGKMIVRA